MRKHSLLSALFSFIFGLVGVSEALACGLPSKRVEYVQQLQETLESSIENERDYGIIGAQKKQQDILAEVKKIVPKSPDDNDKLYELARAYIFNQEHLEALAQDNFKLKAIERIREELQAVREMSETAYQQKCLEEQQQYRHDMAEQEKFEEVPYDDAEDRRLDQERDEKIAAKFAEWKRKCEKRKTK